MDSTHRTRLFEAFANLTKLNIESNKHMPVPEIIIMGEQSSGKSSVVEGFVGQRFNFIGAGIATKVPLVLSLLSNPNYETPKWELRQDGEWKTMPIAAIKEYVSAVNGRLGNEVSHDAIFLRVTRNKEHNLNIIDLPGLRAIGHESLMASIDGLVKSYIQRPNAIILCLDQATSDLANSKALSFVQKHADPELKRTIYVANKFDNQIDNLKSDESTKKYFDPPSKSEGLADIAHLRRFYVCMFDKGEKVDDDEAWLQSHAQIANKHQQMLRVRGMLNNDILSHVGFPNLDNHLSDLLYQNYKAALPRILPHLENLLGSSQKQLDEVSKLSVRSIRTQMNLASEAVVKCVEELLDGYVSKTTKLSGKLLKEDVNASDEMLREVNVPFANHALCGGGQYRRLVIFFADSARLDRQWAKERVTRDSIVAQLHQIREAGLQTWEHIVSKFAREGLKGENGLESSITLLTDKASQLINNLAVIACECLGDDEFRTDYYDSYTFLKKNPKFKKEMLDYIQEYVKRLKTEARASMHILLNSAANKSLPYTKSVEPVATDDISGLLFSGYAAPVRPQYKATALAGYKCDPNTQITEDIVEEIRSGVTIVFGALAKDLLDMFVRIFDSLFKIPLFRNLSLEMVKLEQQMDDRRIEQMFGVTEREIEASKKRLEQQITDVHASMRELNDIISSLPAGSR